MRTIDNQSEDFLLNGWSLLLGVGLIVAPWHFGFASEPFAAWNAWIFGGTAVILAVLALRQTYDWEVYALAATGIWICLAPWTLDFQESSAATWTHASFGMALIVSASAELRRLHEAPSAYEV